MITSVIMAMVFTTFRRQRRRLNKRRSDTPAHSSDARTPRHTRATIGHPGTLQRRSDTPAHSSGCRWSGVFTRRSVLGCRIRRSDTPAHPKPLVYAPRLCPSSMPLVYAPRLCPSSMPLVAAEQHFTRIDDKPAN